MKYSFHYKHYTSKSNYPYWVIIADQDLTKFHVWSKTKSFNCTLYTEEQVHKLIQEKYPGAERIDRVVLNRRKTGVSNVLQKSNSNEKIKT